MLLLIFVIRRIKTHLPGAKEKWDLNEEPKASEQNKEKIAELELEQTVSNDDDDDDDNKIILLENKRQIKGA